MVKFKAGDLLWYHGPHLPQGLYSYEEECGGRNGGKSFWDRHRISSLFFKVTNPLSGIKTTSIFEVDGCHIRAASEAERILYGQKG